MKRFAPAFYTFSWVIMGFSFTFLVPMAWALREGWHHTLNWAGSLVFTLACGFWLWLRTHRARRELTVRDGFLLVNLVWMLLPAFAALPLALNVHGMGWTRAYFEAMSGFTATGATVLAGLDLLPTSVNIWRCFLQLIGGLGIMLLVVAILPFLGLGGMQLYRAEVHGPLKDTRLTPRIAKTARGLWSVYFILSAACLVAYRAGGMTWSDAFMHMCATMGLGGFSSHDKSFAYWNSAQIEWTAVLFMALSGIGFARYFLLWRRRSLKPLTGDAEVRAYVLVLLAASVLVGLMLVFNQVYGGTGVAMRSAVFQVVSVATTTGFSTTDYVLWPSFVPMLLLFLGCFVPCAGSTGSGIKMVRMLVMIRVAQREMMRIVHPRVVYPITLSGTTVPKDTVAAFMAFMLFYGGAMIGLTLLLQATGLDLVTAFSAIIACLNNIGPGLGQIGPLGNYGTFNAVQLWICSVAMLIGRLELLSVLVLLTPQFWRR
ncbi:MAG: potassium transporter TrkG [Ottowia sp.]|nr:TrkH family potassium uptake protein [Ottowia sp.]